MKQLAKSRKQAMIYLKPKICVIVFLILYIIPVLKYKYYDIQINQSVLKLTLNIIIISDTEE